MFYRLHATASAPGRRLKRKVFDDYMILIEKRPNEFETCVMIRLLMAGTNMNNRDFGV